MCRGVQESGFWQSPILIPSGGLVCCELCNSRASLYCLADDAFLCRKCDRWVHGANFLALRHTRCLLCNTCQNLTRRYVVGIAVKVMLPTILSRVDRNRCESNAKSREEEVREEAENAEGEGAEESSGDGVLTVGEKEYYPKPPEKIKLYNGALSYKLDFSRTGQRLQLRYYDDVHRNLTLSLRLRLFNQCFFTHTPRQLRILSVDQVLSPTASSKKFHLNNHLSVGSLRSCSNNKQYCCLFCWSEAMKFNEAVVAGVAASPKRWVNVAFDMNMNYASVDDDLQL
ncbi:hypothetical protein C1H46_024467 [Malus baccata]|uniref:B box-type domain-containing protein n=1 Tax=Malus baccata TaxID=106549 RepID=A0A540LTZ5_MALBA|nr:hypothetical protein C1H46_024467 [Malus baccata]